LGSTGGGGGAITTPAWADDGIESTAAMTVAPTASAVVRVLKLGFTDVWILSIESSPTELIGCSREKIKFFEEIEANPSLEAYDWAIRCVFVRKLTSFNQTSPGLSCQ
jgi:hypothetical protein